MNLLPPAEGNVFTLFTIFWGGGSTPSQVWRGGYPSQVWMGGYPIPGLDRGVPHAGVPPIQVPGQDGVPGVPPPNTKMGYPPSAGWDTPPPPGQDRGVPQLEQHGVYLLRGGRYASHVHAGGLSCCFSFRQYVAQ